VQKRRFNIDRSIDQSEPKKKSSWRKANVRPNELAEMIQKPPSLPSIDELIAECHAYGMKDVAKSLERIRYLESPKGQRALERRERRLSRL
jgi:hypothetical protein